MEFASSEWYDVVGEAIGSGEFGVVYRIKSKTNGKLYALRTVDLNKLKTPTTTTDAEELQQVERLKKLAIHEVDLLKKLQPHSHIVNVFGWFTVGSVFHIVMELFIKGTLKQAILRRRGEAFPETQVTKWAAQLALTMKHLHHVNVLHRDLKTDNIFLTENDDLKLADFGIGGTFLDSNLSARMTIVTLTNMAPELFEDENAIYNEKAEIWAFGVVLYEIAQLQLPFPASKNFRAMMNAICTKPIPPITNNSLSSELRSLIETELLNRDPNQRPSTAQVTEKQCLSSAIISQSHNDELGRLRKENEQLRKHLGHSTHNGAQTVPKWISKHSSGQNLHYNYEPALFDAVIKNDFEKVEVLLHRGADCNAKNKDNQDYTALHYTAEIGHVKMVLFLLKKGANVDAKNVFGMTPLMIACYNGKTDVARALIDHKADVNANDQNGCTPLIIAVKRGALAIVQMLVEDPKFNTLNHKDTLNNKTAVEYAAQERRNDILEYLRSKGV